MTLTAESALRKDRTTGAKLEHRHFAFIAAVIAAMPDHAATLRAQKRSVALAFGDACSRTNPRFDYGRFMRACGVEQ
jgi:hypothetical protein